MMLGQVWPTAGSVHICGHPVPARRSQALFNVGAIFETPAFYDYLSGLANLEILSSYTGPASPQRIREVLDWVGLLGRENAKVRTYSHGMRSRLAIAQALLPQPKLLILDEPSDGLDPEGIHDMRHTILRLNRELGITILLSSHFLVEVEQLCSRIAVLKRGKLVYEGPITSAGQPRSLLRLKVSDFQAAVRLLTGANLISQSHDHDRVSLNPGIESKEVARILLANNFDVHEMAYERQTLEDFYLQLMDKNDSIERQATPAVLKQS